MKSLSSLLFGKQCQITCSFGNMPFHFSFLCLIHFSISLDLVLFLYSGTLQPSLCSPNFLVQGMFSNSVFLFFLPTYLPAPFVAYISQSLLYRCTTSLFHLSFVQASWHRSVWCSFIFSQTTTTRTASRSAKAEESGSVALQEKTCWSRKGFTDVTKTIRKSSWFVLLINNRVNVVNINNLHWN